MHLILEKGANNDLVEEALAGTDILKSYTVGQIRHRIAYERRLLAKKTGVTKVNCINSVLVVFVLII